MNKKWLVTALATAVVAGGGIGGNALHNAGEKPYEGRKWAGIVDRKRLMVSVNGTIHLESEEQQGTSVYLHFPRNHEEPSLLE